MRTRISEKNITEVWDAQRQKWVKLTPEEEVRQRFVELLINEYGYPQPMIGNEVSITVGQTNRRCDTVVFGRDTKPLMIIEYKAPSVQITQRVFDQILRYDMKLQVKWLIVTNGKKCYCVKCNVSPTTTTDSVSPPFEFLPAIPRYQEL